MTTRSRSADGLMETLYCNGCGQLLNDQWEMPGDRGIYCRRCALIVPKPMVQPPVLSGSLELATKRLRNTSGWVQKATETLRTTRQMLEAAQVAAQEALSDWHRANRAMAEATRVWAAYSERAEAG